MTRQQIDLKEVEQEIAKRRRRIKTFLSAPVELRVIGSFSSIDYEEEVDGS